MKIMITLLLTLCIFGQVFAQESVAESHHASILLKAEYYGVPQGLSQSTITSLVEDKNGYVWIGTLNGLNRFDGEEFKPYFASNKNGSLPSSFIRSLLLTKDGRLIIGTDKGIVTYNRKFDTFIKPVGLPNQPIWTMLESDKNIFLGTEDSILVLNKNLELRDSISGSFNGVKKIITSKDNLYLRNYSGEILQLTKHQPTTITEHTLDFIKVNQDLIILKNDGVYTFKNNQLEKENNDIYDSITLNKGEITAIKGELLYKLDSDLHSHEIGKIDSGGIKLSNPAVYKGSKGSFITSHNVGFLELKDSNNIVSTLDITRENVWSLNLDEKSNLLVATDSEFIYLYDKNYNLVDKYNTDVEGPKQVVKIKDEIFIATVNGLSTINLNSKEKNSISHEQFFAIHASADKDVIYAGTINGKVVKIDTNTLHTQEYIIDQKTPIFDIEEYNNALWIATQSGLLKLQDNKFEKIYDKELVISVHADNELIYFGTESSLVSYDEKNDKTSIIYSQNKPIYSITSNDTSIYSASIKEITVTNKTSNKSTSLSNLYGSQDEYNAQSITKNQESILFGGISGISLISPNKVESILSTPTIPMVNFKDLLVFNITENIGGEILKSHLSATKKITLKYSDYPFTLIFNTPGSGCKNIEYVYQMLELSESWIESKGINSATYTNLSPGDYTFKIYAVDPLTKSVGPTKSLQIEITPPWWLSLQAKFIYLMFSLIISGTIVKAMLRRREVQNQIAKSEERLKLSLWGSGDEMWDWDIETGQIYRSNIWGSLEFPRDGQRSGENGEESNIHPMDQERVSSALNNHFYGKTDHFEAAYRVKGKSDEWVWILDRAKIVERDEQDNALRMTGTIKNINNFKHAEEQLRLFERAIANISEGMFILDSNFNFVEVNEACCELSMTSREQFIGTQLNFDRYPESYSEQIRSILHQQGSWSNEVESAKGDGKSFLMELTVDAIYDELGQLSHYVGVFSDISRRKQQEEELRKLTNNDLLTNLPNRSSLMVTLGNLVKRDSHHTLMVLDLDNFKKINDSLGHQVGDELLIKVAKRIEDTVPYHTSIYRLGGDEFAILVDNNPDIGSSAVIANKVIDAFVSPFELSSDKVVVGMSIGIVLYPEDDQNEQALLRKADIAMYHAKSGGGNRYQFYSESLNRNAIRQLEVENLIREGLRDDLFEVYYQPKIDLKSGKMAGMEALVRLNHPEHGLIPPSDFIPLAEENGLIVEIGDLVMKKACFAAQKWRSQGIFDGRVAVNLSSHQFALPDLQQRIESILRLTQLPAANLELEITEGTVIKQPEKAIKVMQQLAKMGVSLALDDFGTGYSSLSYLKRFPIHTLKIDKAFVDDIDKSDRDLKMVDSIITIAHNMGLSVVGEGVEDASQLSILKALKCEEIQGFIFSKAVTESEFTKLLHKEFIEPESVQKGSKAM